MDVPLYITEIQGLKNNMAMDFQLINQYVNEIIITDDLLEIGTDRHEGSTNVLANIAARNNKTLYSVDMDTAMINCNIEKYQELPVKFHNLKGEEFLEQNPSLKFSVVLLDNFDWNWEPNRPLYHNTLTQFEEYRDIYNLEMTNINSQQAHLIQALKLTNMLSEQCVVACDDTFINDHTQTYDGKCGAAIPYLLTLGFVAYPENAGFVLVRK